MFNKFKELNKAISEFGSSYWLLNLIQMIERMAYWMVVLQLPIYIAQKDAAGGLHWEQTDKGIIYFWWALTQNLIPIFAGAVADKYGRRRVLLLSFIIAVAGFILIGTQREFMPFLAGAVILGLGLGLFKPALQGSLAMQMNDNNSNAGWSINIMLINLSVFFGSYLSKNLREISWESVFWGSVAVFSINFLLLIFLKRSQDISSHQSSSIIKKIAQNLFKRKVALFILLMSGFTMVYMQFYETLPNFIFDWINTTDVVQDLQLPAFLTTETNLGISLSYEALFSINSFLIILFIVPISWIFAGKKLTLTILVGILISTFGLMLSGSTMYGWIAISGILVYTFGEMITNPRFAEYMAKISPVEDKSLFMGFMSISWAIGLAGGGLLGGYFYKHLAEKSGFAMRYLSENHPELSNITHTNAFDSLLAAANLSAIEANNLLWKLYSPWQVWLPFVIISFLSIFGLFLYSKTHEK